MHLEAPPGASGEAAVPAAPEFPDATMRSPTQSDAEALAELMLAAYRGQIDDEGESIDEARREVTDFLEGRLGGAAKLESSWLCLLDGRLAGACLVSWWAEHDAPLVTHVMTGAEWKGRGIAAALLRRSLRSLADEGQREVRAVITEGNTPSERLFLRAGFEKVPRPA